MQVRNLQQSPMVTGVWFVHVTSSLTLLRDIPMSHHLSLSVPMQKYTKEFTTTPEQMHKQQHRPWLGQIWLFSMFNRPFSAPAQLQGVGSEDRGCNELPGSLPAFHSSKPLRRYTARACGLLQTKRCGQKTDFSSSLAIFHLRKEKTMKLRKYSVNCTLSYQCETLSLIQWLRKLCADGAWCPGNAKHS